jgi:hypothetical protein
MNNLHSVYDVTEKSEKLPFSVGDITDTLRSEPLNLDISCIIHTPQSVIVKKSRDDYMNEKIAQVVRDKFDVSVTCRADMLVFM